MPQHHSRATETQTSWVVTLTAMVAMLLSLAAPAELALAETERDQLRAGATIGSQAAMQLSYELGLLPPDSLPQVEYGDEAWREPSRDLGVQNATSTPHRAIKGLREASTRLRSEMLTRLIEAAHEARRVKALFIQLCRRSVGHLIRDEREAPPTSGLAAGSLKGALQPLPDEARPHVLTVARLPSQFRDEDVVLIHALRGLRFWRRRMHHATSVLLSVMMKVRSAVERDVSVVRRGHWRPWWSRAPPFVRP